MTVLNGWDVRLQYITNMIVDMDYTLAGYKSPEYENLSYDLLVQKLLNMGYPKELEKLKFNPEFPIRYKFFFTPDKIEDS